MVLLKKAEGFIALVIFLKIAFICSFICFLIPTGIPISWLLVSISWTKKTTSSSRSPSILCKKMFANHTKKKENSVD